MTILPLPGAVVVAGGGEEEKGCKSFAGSCGRMTARA
jgi:hypothetical protein